MGKRDSQWGLSCDQWVRPEVKEREGERERDVDGNVDDDDADDDEASANSMAT